MPLEDQIPELAQEHRDLLILLRAAIREEIPSTPVDWQKVLPIARFHQVDLFLYPAVATWPAAFQPDPTLLSRWRNAYFAATVKYERASTQLKEILQALHAADVPVIPLKGAWLAEKIYKEGAQRPMCDFDLLVPLEQLNEARTVFEALGYTTPDHYFDTTRNKDIHYRHPSHPLMIELHFRVWHEGKINVVEPDRDQLWLNPVADTLRGVPVLTFPPERQLCYLIQHILHHSLTIGLKAYLDLILLIQKNTFNAKRLEEEAKALGVPFGAKFVTRVALDIAGEEPSSGLAEFLAAKDDWKGVATNFIETQDETEPPRIVDDREDTKNANLLAAKRHKKAQDKTEPPWMRSNPVHPVIPSKKTACHDDEQAQKKRRMAFVSILELSGGSALIKPEIADSREASLVKRLQIGFGVVFKPAGFIRTAYPEAVRKGGLIGGYRARLTDLLKRSQPVRAKTQHGEETLASDFENFDARRDLSQWIHERDRNGGS